jgi:hypothetical protein
LDARRIATVVGILDEAPEMSYEGFLHMMRFAMPVRSLLEFRTRLVQMYGRVDTAFRILGLVNSELDVGLFERPMLGAGIVSSDAHRIFRVMDAAGPGGPSGHLPYSAMTFALDNAHVLAWLEAFYARIAATAKGRSVAEIIKQSKKAGSHADNTETDEEQHLGSPPELESSLANLGFPVEFIPATFAFLEQICSPRPVTLAALADLIRNAFEDKESQRKRGPGLTSAKDALKKAVVAARFTKTPAKRSGTMHMHKQGTVALHKQGTMGSGMGEALLGPDLGGRGPLDASSQPSSAPGAEQNVSPAAIEQAVVNLRYLRRQVMFSFNDYQEAYNRFRMKRAKDGIALDEWMEAMSSFGWTDPAEWEIIFGYMVDWQHMRWNPRFHGASGRVTLSKFANTLDRAVPCETPLALRQLRQEKFGSLQKAWIHLAGGGGAGREGVEEIGLIPWQHALQALAVAGDDAAYVLAVLRAAPILERNRNLETQEISRVAFMSAMRGADSISRLLDLLLWLQRHYGSVSRAFEGRLGATHALEIPFAFNNLDRAGVDVFIGPGPMPQQLADTMHNAWSGFMKNGSPDWPSYTIGERSTMVFAETSNTVNDPMGDERSVWEGIR